MRALPRTLPRARVAARTGSRVGGPRARPTTCPTRVHERRARSSQFIALVRDAHDLADRCRVADEAEHEVGDVGPRDQEAPSEVVAVRGPVAAGGRFVGEAGRADNGPVELAVAHDL